MTRSNLNILSGTYVGNGTDNRSIIGLGFNPQLVIVKGGSNISVLRTRTMTLDSCGILVGSSANTSNLIQELVSDGFVVGSDAKVNANGTTYYYIAIKGNNVPNFKVGRYTGNGADNRNFTDVGFQPNIIGIKNTGAANFVFRTSSVVGDLTEFFNSTAEGANRIQSILSNGFQLGNGSEVNTSATYYDYFTMTELSGIISVGSYSGDSNATKSITGLGFSPNIVIVKSSSTQQARMKVSSETGQNSLFMGGTAESTTGILSLDADGFTVDSHASVNGVGSTFYWIALKTGNYSIPITRTSV